MSTATTTRVIAHDKFHRLVEQPGGNLTVSIEQAGEHHMALRAAALRWARTHLPAPGRGQWAIGAYIGPEHYRRADGYKATARRYSIVYVGLNQPPIPGADS